MTLPISALGPSLGLTAAMKWYILPRTSRPRILLTWHFARSFRRERVVGLPGIVLGAISVSLSAMMYWAFTPQVRGIRLASVRWIPEFDGEAGTAVSAIVFSTSRSSEHTHHIFDRQVSGHQSLMPPTLRVLSSATTRPPYRDARGTSDHRTVRSQRRQSTPNVSFRAPIL
jgi:hypothetical protein